jgi:BMFP domain-containing protein YqiC
MSARDWVSELPLEYREKMERLNRAAARTRDEQRALMAQALADAAEAEAALDDAYPLRQLAADLSAALGDVAADTVSELLVRVEALEARLAQIEPLLAEWEVID